MVLKGALCSIFFKLKRKEYLETRRRRSDTYHDVVNDGTVHYYLMKEDAALLEQVVARNTRNRDYVREKSQLAPSYF